jgi:hypothetical protein
MKGAFALNARRCTNVAGVLWIHAKHVRCISPHLRGKWHQRAPCHTLTQEYRVDLVVQKLTFGFEQANELPESYKGACWEISICDLCTNLLLIPRTEHIRWHINYEATAKAPSRSACDKRALSLNGPISWLRKATCCVTQFTPQVWSLRSGVHY